jgi:hypothetical protein
MYGVRRDGSRACSEIFYAGQALERFNKPIEEFLSLAPFIQGVYRAIIDTHIERDKQQQAKIDEIQAGK